MAKKKPSKRTTTKKVQDSENIPPIVLPNIALNPEDDRDEDFDGDGLNIRRRKFVEAITGVAFGNATKAARIAGYADESLKALGITASRLLGNASVQRAISRATAAQGLDAKAVSIGIAEIAQTNMANFLRVGDDGKPTMDWPAASAAGAIGQIREWTEEGFEHGGEVTIIKRKFKIHDRLKALEILARINGQLIERKDITSGGLPLKAYVDIDDGDSNSGGIKE